MIYIYSANKSPAAYELVKALDGTRLRNFDGLDFWIGSKRVIFTETDIIVPWGSRLPDIDGVRVCNPHKPFKRSRLCSYLNNKGVQAVSSYDFQYSSTAVGRLDDSTGGKDLLFPPSKADYWVSVEKFTKVYRLHSFAGKSIRAGVKVVRDGFNLVPAKEWAPNEKLAHPWVMTHDAGWRLDYDFSSTKPLRNLAHKAVRTLGLTFGAVDIGEREDGALIIIKVDPSPKIEGGTVVAYAKSIEKWAANSEVEGVEGVSLTDDNEEPIAADAPHRASRARAAAPRVTRADPNDLYSFARRYAAAVVPTPWPEVAFGGINIAPDAPMPPEGGGEGGPF